ncbi:hypothetical protein [Fictibacillus norfolkensis]|nr:hypothetical protein [Fictibacillus norfolkensis]
MRKTNGPSSDAIRKAIDSIMLGLIRIAKKKKMNNNVSDKKNGS